MLPLLDLHGIKRLDFHNSVLEDLRLVSQSHLQDHFGSIVLFSKLLGWYLGSCISYFRDKLTDQIALMDKMEGKAKDKKLQELLIKSFPVIKIKQLRPVVMSVLKNMSYIEDKSTGEKMYLEDRGGMFMLKVWVRSASKPQGF